MFEPIRPALVPALISLAITLIRLAGELLGWAPRWFSTAPGGGAALLGITWLVPVFGAWFGWRLARDPDRPRARRTIPLHLAAIVTWVGGFQFVIHVLKFDTSTRDGLIAQLLSMAAASVLAALIAWAAWPRLARLDLAYAVLARIPVVLITFVAVIADWGTHYEKLGPDDYAGFPPVVRAVWLAVAQLVFWPAFTLAAGGLFGSLVAACVPRGDRADGQ